MAPAFQVEWPAIVAASNGQVKQSDGALSPEVWLFPDRIDQYGEHQSLLGAKLGRPRVEILRWQYSRGLEEAFDYRVDVVDQRFSIPSGLIGYPRDSPAITTDVGCSSHLSFALMLSDVKGFQLAVAHARDDRALGQCPQAKKLAPCRGSFQRPDKPVIKHKGRVRFRVHKFPQSVETDRVKATSKLYTDNSTNVRECREVSDSMETSSLVKNGCGDAA